MAAASRCQKEQDEAEGDICLHPIRMREKLMSELPLWTAFNWQTQATEELSFAAAAGVAHVQKADKPSVGDQQLQVKES